MISPRHWAEMSAQLAAKLRLEAAINTHTGQLRLKIGLCAMPLNESIKQQFQIKGIHQKEAWAEMVSSADCRNAGKG